MTRRAPRVVIFDVDGTLVDSNDAHARAWVDAFAEQGVEVSFERMRPLIGMGGDRLLRSAAGLEHREEPGRTIAERRGEIFASHYLRTVRPFPRARALVERVRDGGAKAVVATSGRAEDLTPLLELADVEELFDAMATSSDAARSKPDPDIVLAAVLRSGHRADECVMIGDTPYDIAAATAAHVPVIALRCGGWPDAELEGAAAVYEDPAELLERYEESLLRA